ncbi:Na+/H+ antiporter subunit A [Streptomyces sp. TRM49041]|uniref:Na+/H+ antiporter subunit A n=1 Tax=Streptomyces sp. TRM49041 TaxID=2603216 RepID=UPI0011EEEF14|nr:Na+/H+ antiporter subunit A [Streptomyces sp. TRM49041]
MLYLLAAHAGVALVLPWWGRRLGRGVWFLAALVPLATVAWAGAQAAGVLGGVPVRESVQWAPTLGLTVDLRLDALALLMLWIVGGVGALVLLYSHHYVVEDHAREAALLVAFAGAMSGLVLADNLFVLYVFWELTTVVSFLLIAGRGMERPRRWAARQALLVTAAGGLAMLLGFVLLGQAAGTYRISAILADPPRGATVAAAVALVLVGAFAKSAQMPLHGWLPAAMVAPTPVSAYLHAAAMVKAGVYLVARLAPGLADAGPWRPMVLAVGLTTMVLAAWRALTETDLKRLLAYGTVSELGMLIALLGAGTRTAAVAGTVMLAAHAAFKAALFLTVGIVDHRTGTRDLRELSGLGRREPALYAVAALAAASMAGLPPLLGYLGKEAAYEAFLHPPMPGGGWLLMGLVTGSVLTVAYSARFLAGAFGGDPPEGGTSPTAGRLPPGFVAPAAALSVAGLVLGVYYPAMATVARAYADGYPTGPDGGYDIALWHGLTPVLGLSALTVAAGALVYAGTRGRLGEAVGRLLALPGRVRAENGFERARSALDAVALWLTGRTQVGSLPVYLTVILLTLAFVPGTALAAMGPSLGGPRLWRSLIEIPLALGVLATTFAVVRTRYRLTGVLMAGAVGYGVAGLFLLQGAPDLALTQFLVETMTLVVIVLVLRRMPARFTPGRTTRPVRLARATVAALVGVFAATLALVTTSVEHPPAVSVEQLRLLPETGAHNAVNAIIVDFRALDTMGEIAVLLVTAIGVVSLIRVWTDGRPRTPTERERERQREQKRERERERETPTRAAHWDEPQEKWLPGADERPGEERSVLLEVVTRLLFPSALVLALFLLFSGHDRPGGGFAGGLVASQALVLRYLVGGRADLGVAIPVGPGAVAGTGFAVAAGTGLLPVAYGEAPLTSTVLTTHLPVVGTVKFATSLFFDIGVYLLVIGVTLKLLSGVGVSLANEDGADREQRDEPAAEHRREGA